MKRKGPKSTSVYFSEFEPHGTEHNSEYPAPAVRPPPKLLPLVATSGTRGSLDAKFLQRVDCPDLRPTGKRKCNRRMITGYNMINFMLDIHKLKKVEVR